MELLIVAGVLTAVGTAVLTVASVWKLLMSPISTAIRKIEESVNRLESRIEAGEAKRESDIKDVWKYLAERQSHEGR
jgi:hypothetical protein